jgi:hypothetical protein
MFVLALKNYALDVYKVSFPVVSILLCPRRSCWWSVCVFRRIACAYSLHSLCLQTYNSDAQIGESSACATALLCGVKANFETVGLDSGGRFENCFSSFSSRVPSLFDWAQQAGKCLSD